jgi:2-polyprenyl-6-methoxyphenol hydroxylase-like FAD-dependent oxidoreductase
MEIFNFVTGSETNLYKKPLLTMDYTTTEGGTGHVGFICHKQPAMEKAIRDRLQTLSPSEIRTESTLTGISEDDKGVTVEYTDSYGKTHKLSAPYLVGADGKTGYVRKRYLEPKGVVMEKCKEYVGPAPEEVCLTD